MKAVFLFLCLLSLVFAGGDGGSQRRCWTRRVKPRFQCYDASGFAVFGYRAMSKNASETSGFSFSVDPLTSYLTNGDGSRVDGPADFRIGCWTDAWSVPVIKPPKGRKVIWTVGTEKAEVNFRKLCGSDLRDTEEDEDDDGNAKCQPLPVDCNWASNCDIACSTNYYAAYDATGSCTCRQAVTVELNFPLVGDSHATAYALYLSNLLDIANVNPGGFDVLGNPSIRTVHDAVRLYQPFKNDIVNIVNNALGPLLVSCLDSQDVVFYAACPANAGGVCTTVGSGALSPVFNVSVLVTLGLDPNVDLSTMTQKIHTSLESYVSGNIASWNGLIHDANAALCGHASIVGILYSTEQAEILACNQTISSVHTTCCPGLCTASYTAIPDLTGSVYRYGQCLNPSGGVYAGGPDLFTTSTGSNSLYFSLIDETGKTTYTGHVIQSRSAAEGYLSLSPTYLVIAAAVVVALAIGSVVGVVVYKRKHAATVMAEDEAQAMWTSAKASEGRSRAAGLVQ